jgi:hypothetical protein
MQRRRRRGQKNTSAGDWSGKSRSNANVEQQQQIERTKRRWEFLSDRIETFERADKIDQFLHHLRSSLSENEQLGTQMRELIDWAKRYSESVRKACTAGEIDKALVDAELFKPRRPLLVSLSLSGIIIERSSI